MNNTDDKRIAIVLGGTEDHIALVRKLQQQGFFVVLIDYYDNPPAKSISDEHIRESILNKEAVLEIAARKNASLVIAACIDQALPTMAYVSEKLSLPCHLSYSKAVQITNKEQMKMTFSNSGVPTSKFLIFDKKDRVNLDGLSFPIVIKPLDANSSKGVVKVYDTTKIERAIEYAIRAGRTDKFVIEEYVSGKEFSADIVIKDGEAHVLMVTENVKSQVDLEHFTITESLFSLEIFRKFEPSVKVVAENIAKTFCLDNTILLIQAIINDKGISVVEFSARIGGGSKSHFIKGITGFDILDFYLLPLLKHNISYTSSDIAVEHGSVSYLYGHNCVFKGLGGVDELKKNGIINDYFYYKTPGMSINDHTTSSDRPGGYMILENNYRLFQSKHREARDKIQVLSDRNINVRMDI